VLRSLSRRLHTWLSYVHYQVPWCVPQWGLGEFASTVCCMVTGHLARGPEPARLAEALRASLNVPYALPVGQGRVAIALALHALGLGSDDEVVLPSYVCASVLDAVRYAGLKPIFADVGPDLHVTSETVAAALTPKTKCVIVPHLFGNTAPIEEIAALLHGTGIHLIDDAAQSLGAHRAGRLVGTFGTCGIVSCGPGKPLAGSAGGVLVTADAALFERASRIALAYEPEAAIARRVGGFWLWRRFRKFSLGLLVLRDRLLGPPGADRLRPTLLSNLEAAVANVFLRTLQKHVQERRRNAIRLLEALGPLARWSILDLSGDGAAAKLALVLPAGGPAVSELIDQFAQVGVECQAGYTPCHQTAGIEATLPETERLWQRVLCIPLETALRRPWRLARAARNAARNARATSNGALDASLENVLGGV